MTAESRKTKRQRCGVPCTVCQTALTRHAPQKTAFRLPPEVLLGGFLLISHGCPEVSSVGSVSEFDSQEFRRNPTQGVGGFKTTVDAFLFMLNFSTFPGGLGKMAASRSPEKSPLVKSQPGGVRPRSVGVWMLMAGVDVLLVARMAGTSVAMIERVYGHFRNESYQEAQARLDRDRATRGH